MLHRPKFQIFSTQSNIMVKVVRYLPKQKQPFTGAYSRLQNKAYSWVSFLPKLQAYNLKKDSVRDFFQWVCLILQNIFLQKLFGWWMVLLNTIHFLCWVDLISKILLSTLAMFWLSLNISRINMVRRLWRAVSGSPRQLVDLLVMKQAICRKCS